MSRTLKKIIYTVVLVVGMLVMGIFVNQRNMTMAYIVLGITCAVTLYILHHLRCPHCGAWPIRGTMFAKYCRHCGGKLDD